MFVARPVPQRRIGALAGDRLVRGERGLQLSELLTGETETGERTIAIGGLDVLELGKRTLIRALRETAAMEI